MGIMADLEKCATEIQEVLDRHNMYIVLDEAGCGDGYAEYYLSSFKYGNRFKLDLSNTVYNYDAGRNNEEEDKDEPF